MTFDDVDHVEVDFDSGTFVIVRKNGAINGPYFIEEERGLFTKLYDLRNEIPVESLSSEEVDEYGNRYYLGEY